MLSDHKTLKAREYNTSSLLTHESTPCVQINIRNSNTFKSEALEAPRPGSARTKHDLIFAKKPNSEQVMRASYQDSNIFLQSSRNAATVVKQSSSVLEKPARNTDTFKSRTFADENMEAQPARKPRDQLTYKSQVFGTGA